MKDIKSNFKSPQRRKNEENKTTNESTWNIFVATFSFGVLASLIFVIYFVISPFTSTNNSWKNPRVILNFILLLAKFTWKHLCWSHFLTTLQVSRHEISLKRDSGTGEFHCEFSAIFQKISFTEHLWMTAPADSSVPTKVLSIDHSLFVFSFIFFLLLLIIAIVGVCSESV